MIALQKAARIISISLFSVEIKVEESQRNGMAQPVARSSAVFRHRYITSPVVTRSVS
jgi:hypothetical protein